LSTICFVDDQSNQSNNFNKELIVNVSKIKFLKKLHFANFHSDDESDWFPLAELTYLEELFLNKTSITDLVLKKIASLPRLRILRLLENIKITATGIISLKTIQSLQAVDLSFNPQIPIGVLPATQTKHFENDILHMVWEMMPQEDREEFWGHYSDQLDNNFSVLSKICSKKKILFFAILLLKNSNMFSLLKKFLNLSQGDLALSQKELNYILEIYKENDSPIKMIALLMNAGARLEN
jgi:hypothetical protein